VFIVFHAASLLCIVDRQRGSVELHVPTVCRRLRFESCETVETICNANPRTSLQFWEVGATCNGLWTLCEQPTSNTPGTELSALTFLKAAEFYSHVSAIHLFVSLILSAFSDFSHQCDPHFVSPLCIIDKSVDRSACVLERSSLFSGHHASRVVTVIMRVVELLFFCAVAVMPTLSLNYTYETKYLDVPVSTTEPGPEKCHLLLLFLVRRLFISFNTAFYVKNVTRPGTGRPDVDSRQSRVFPFATMPRPFLGPTQPPIQCVPGSFRQDTAVGAWN
jgi:hypothetical protein